MGAAFWVLLLNTVVVPVLWALISLFISIFLHELGHVLAARWVGGSVTSFGLGFGSPLLTWSWGNTRVYLCRGKMLGGLTYTFFPSFFPKTQSTVMMLSGGMAMNALLSTCSFVFVSVVALPSMLWWAVVIFGAVNVSLFVSSAFPYQSFARDAPLMSDGSMILSVLQNKEQALLPSSRIEQNEMLGGLFERVDDRAGHVMQDVISANLWLQLGVSGLADEHAKKVDAAVFSEIPMARSYAWFVKGLCALECGRLEEAEQALQVAGESFRDSGDEGGVMLWKHALVGLHIERGELERAGALLEELWASGEVKKNPRFLAGLSASALELAMALEEPRVLDEALRDFEEQLHATPSRPLEFLVRLKLAPFHAARGEHQQATSSYLRGVELLGLFNRGFQDPAKQMKFLEKHHAFLEEARKQLRGAKLEVREQERVLAQVDLLLGWNELADTERAGIRLKPGLSFFQKVWRGVWLVLLWCLLVVLFACVLHFVQGA